MAFNDSLDFQPSLEKLSKEKAPFHVLLSGYLRMSRTFEMYAALSNSSSLDCKLVPFELSDRNSQNVEAKLSALISLLKQESNFRSIMVSDPFKQKVQSFLDRISERALACGAVNVLLKRGNIVEGDNFDGEAFFTSIVEQEGLTFDRKKMVFFGCGGVSSAVSSRLTSVLEKIALVDLDSEKANVLREILHRQNKLLKIELLQSSGARDFREFDYLYNGTGLGKSDNNSPINSADLLSKDGVAFDANYTPANTPFLKQLNGEGYRSVNGLSHMLTCTSMHLSAVTDAPVTYETVKKAYEQIVVTSDSTTD
jgi:shikimate dehydrogenase